MRAAVPSTRTSIGRQAGKAVKLMETYVQKVRKDAGLPTGASDGKAVRVCPGAVSITDSGVWGRWSATFGDDYCDTKVPPPPPSVTFTLRVVVSTSRPGVFVMTAYRALIRPSGEDAMGRSCILDPPPPPRQGDARGSADARSSAGAGLSQQKVQRREANRRRHRLTQPTTKALCQPPMPCANPPPPPCERAAGVVSTN